MANRGVELPTEDIKLTLENSPKLIPGFIKVGIPHSHNGQFSKTLASAFLKFTKEGKALSHQDSVDSFIHLSDLHRELTEEAQHFLQEEVPFIYADQQIQPLLLNFAVFRLKQISRQYYFATLQNQPQAILTDLKSVIKQRQEEYEELLHHV